MMKPVTIPGSNSKSPLHPQKIQHPTSFINFHTPASLLIRKLDMASPKKRRVHNASLKISESPPTRENIFTNYAIFERIFTHLDPGGVMALRATTKQLVRAIDSLSRTQWDINSSLRRFVNNPVGFRSLMGRHDALISGGFALQLLDRAVWEDSDLDIYVDDSLRDVQRGAEALGQHLIKNEGYELQSNTLHADHNYSERMKFIEEVGG